MKRRTVALSAVTLAAVALLGAPLQSSAQNLMQQIASSSTLEEIKKRGSLRVGFSTFVPWAMRDAKGDFVGFEIEVAKKLAEDNEWELELVPTAWDGIIPSLLANKFDVIIGGMSVTPRRLQTVNFTVPYSYATVGIAANRSVAPDIKTLEDLNNSDVTLAARRGTNVAEWLAKTMPKATLRLFDDDAQAFQEVMNGNAHAMASSEPKPSLWSITYSETLYKPFEESFFNIPSGFAIRKGDPDFLAFLNSWIQIYTANGWLKERNDYWFKTNAWFEQVPENPFAKK